MDTRMRSCMEILTVAALVALAGCATPPPPPPAVTHPAAQTASPPEKDFIEAKFEEVKAKGMEIVHNAAAIPAASYTGARCTLGSRVRKFDGVTYYNDLSKPLTIDFTPKGQEYSSGRGIAIWQGKAYRLGF